MEIRDQIVGDHGHAPGTLPQSEDPAHRAERTSWGVRPGRVSDHDPAVADHRTDV